MADALVKVSWRKDAGGFVVPAGAEGGIAGTCFTLDSGMTLAAAERHGRVVHAQCWVRCLPGLRG